MNRSERLMNVAFGINIVAWGMCGIYYSEPEFRWLPVRMCVSLIHFVTGSLFLRRSQIVKQAKPHDLCAAIPSLVLSGIAFSGSGPLSEWPVFAVLLFCLGTLSTVLSLVQLGRSFAVFPALRAIVTRGPYAWLRHPVYASEMLLVVACFLASMNYVTFLVFCMMPPMLMWRIQTEEVLLSTDSDYEAYRNRVRWKLLPWIW